MNQRMIVVPELPSPNTASHGVYIPVRSSVALRNIPESELRANSARTRNVGRSVGRSVETVLLISSLSSLTATSSLGTQYRGMTTACGGPPSLPESRLPCVSTKERLFVRDSLETWRIGGHTGGRVWPRRAAR